MSNFQTLADLAAHLETHSRTDITEGMSTPELVEFSDSCLGFAAILAELSEYAMYRGAAGCGDHGHEKARKKAEAQAKRVRKALGYTYP